MDMQRAVITIAFVLAAALCARRASADELTIQDASGRTWDALIQEIEDDPATEGRTFELSVTSNGTALACGDYTLSLDRNARAAFAVEDCDPTTGATALRVVRRAPLFDTGDVVPRARKVVVGAVMIRRGRAQGGGAAPQAGSKIWCSVALQPYLRDSLHGTTVPLTPERFTLRPIEEHIDAAPDGSGWIARGESQMSLLFHYDVLDKKTGQVVLESEATLACADRPAGTAQAREWSPPTSVIDPSSANANANASTLMLRGPTAWFDPGAPPPHEDAVILASPKTRTLVASTLGGGLLVEHGKGTPAPLGLLSFSMAWDHLYFPLRMGIGPEVGAAATGLGLTWAAGPLDVYAAPTAGVLWNSDTKIDASVLAGTHIRLGDDGGATPKRIGVALTLEANAPITQDGWWLFSAGIGAWGLGW
jgi:hypothetical protein